MTFARGPKLRCCEEAVRRVESYEFKYPASTAVLNRSHVGVVASGDLEVLLESSLDDCAHVRVRTSVVGYRAIWQSVLDRFFREYRGAVRIEINDFGATPAMVLLRLRQAVEQPPP
jgi:malonate decarboxylase delta subunit